MKFTLNILNKRREDVKRRWPTHLFGGRVRTSTMALIVAFLAVWWVYETYRPQEPPPRNTTPPAQVVPPGFVPDPNYTWVPRTRVEQPAPPVTRIPTTTTPPPPTTTPPVTTTTTTPPPFTLPPPPCLLPPPFCPPSTTPPPEPGPGPVPNMTPPAS
ncbi:hypothetical protein [Mycobacterium simulans]|uniref:hypothetical protein n=1 Tax=Mycobacterium simulans TaxID=627089 RepID=UPI00163FBBDF|nr:hypothetical protein [Mycobacterium simulans]